MMIDGMDDIIRGVERLMGSIIEKLEEQNRIIATLQKEVAELKEKSYKTISETVESVEQPIEELTIEFPVESSIEPVQTHTIESKNYSWMVDIPGAGAQTPTYFLNGSSETDISLIKKLSPISNPFGGNCDVFFLA